MEWNGAYSHKAHGYFNEIIDIGAVKLDANFRTVDRFQAVVKPSVSRKLSTIVQDLTHMEPEELERGVSFQQAMIEWQQWIGATDAAFLTWSQTDLLVLIENFRFFYQRHDIPFMTYYADIQRYCQQQMGVDMHMQLGLRHACEQLGIITEGMETHRALGDSLLTAQVLRRVGNAQSLPSALQRADTVFYERTLFKPVILRDLQNPLIDRTALRFRCPDCERRLRAKASWSFRNRAFCTDLICGSCQKEYRARVQFKQQYDHVDVKRKLMEKIQQDIDESKGADHETDR